MMTKGELISDGIIEDELISVFALLPEEQPIILDGYPRNIEQAKKLNIILEQNNRKLDRVVYINVTQEEAIKRIGKRRICSRCGAFSVERGSSSCAECGGLLTTRDDDKPEAVKERFRIFHERTEPMIGYFREQGILVEVDGDPAPEVVKEEIKASL
jgi:adenylate kinase